MATQVSICNDALLALAQSTPIAALSDNTNVARIFNRVWDDTRDYVLAEQAWPFAMKAAPLELLVETAHPGWGLRYAYPSDCITLLAVSTEDGVRLGTSTLSGRCAMDCNAWFPGRADFEVTHGAQSTAIATDLPLAYGLYIARVEDVTRFPIMFAKALSARLAYETAPAIQGEMGVRNRGQLLQDYEMARSKAAAHGYNEASDSLQRTTPSVAARGY